jgi:hypothetical protein
LRGGFRGGDHKQANRFDDDDEFQTVEETKPRVKPQRAPQVENSDFVRVGASQSKSVANQPAKLEEETSRKIPSPEVKPPPENKSPV